MSTFSEKITEYISKSGLTIAYLSQVSGFEASHITKFKRGTRKPKDKEKFELMVEALRLNPNEKKDLYEAYRIELIGEDIYRQHMAVRDLLISTDNRPKISFDSYCKYNLENISAIYGAPNINSVVKSLIEQEAEKEGGYIKIIAQHDYTFLIELLSLSEKNNPDLPITHLICLETAEKDKKTNVYNVKGLTSLMPVILSKNRYKPKYYYDNNPVGLSNGASMPYMIITSSNVLTISSELEYGILHKDPDIHEIYGCMFQKQEQKCTELTVALETLPKLLGYYLEQEKTVTKNMYNVANEPCFMLFLGREDFEILVKEEVPGREAIIDTVVERNKNMHRVIKMINSFFSEKGLIRFMETGKITEFPDAFCNIVPPKLRVDLLTRLIDRTRAGGYSPYIVKEKELIIPPSLTITAYNKRSMVFIYKNPSRPEASFALYEHSTASAAIDYFEYLKTSHIVYGEEETIGIIQRLIREYS